MGQSSTSSSSAKMNQLCVAVLLGLCCAGALARPKDDIIDIELDQMEHEQEGVAGTAVEGEYSWIAPNGEEVKVKYVADHLGYRALVEDEASPGHTSDEVTFGGDIEEVEVEEEEVEEDEVEEETTTESA